MTIEINDELAEIITKLSTDLYQPVDQVVESIIYNTIEKKEPIERFLLENILNSINHIIIPSIEDLRASSLATRRQISNLHTAIFDDENSGIDSAAEASEFALNYFNNENQIDEGEN